MNTYTFSMTFRCPVDGKPDSYSVTVRSRRTYHREWKRQRAALKGQAVA